MTNRTTQSARHASTACFLCRPNHGGSSGAPKRWPGSLGPVLSSLLGLPPLKMTIHVVATFTQRGYYHENKFSLLFQREGRGLSSVKNLSNTLCVLVPLCFGSYTRILGNAGLMRVCEYSEFNPDSFLCPHPCPLRKQQMQSCSVPALPDAERGIVRILRVFVSWCLCC